MITYTAEYVSIVKDKCIITLDKKVSLDDLKLKKILINGKNFDYSLSHSEDIIITDIPNFNIQGCSIIFI